MPKQTIMLQQDERSFGTQHFADTLNALQQMGPQEGLSRFAASLDPQWVQQALQATGTASIRRRKIPATQVVWMILGMCLFADRSIASVVDHLGLVLPGVKKLARSNVSKSRYRLGSEPMLWLFRRVAHAFSALRTVETYHGLSLHGIDGTHLRVQDSDKNFNYFGKPGGRNGSNDSGYPQLRLVALMDLSSRFITSAKEGSFAVGEQTLAKALVEDIPDKSLTIVDRGLFSYQWFNSVSSFDDERHVMARIKKSLKPQILEILPDGSALAEIKGDSELLKKNPELPKSVKVRVVEYQHPGGEPSRLIVTLLDPFKYPAKELVELYHKRWELEVGFDEIKTHMLERQECLRSKRPEGVVQELYAQLLTYNLVRHEMLVAAQELGVAPNRISFRSSLLWVRNFWITAGITRSPGTLPRQLSELHSTFDALLLPPRRSERRYPRHVKIKMSNYARNRGNRTQPAKNAKKIA